MTNVQEKIAAARERIRKQEQELAELEAREAAKATIVEAFRRGDEIVKIAEDFGLSEHTVRGVLKDAGAIKVVKRKLDAKDEATALNSLRAGMALANVCETHGFAKAAVQKIAKAHGIVQQRQRTASRTPAQIEELRKLEAQVRVQFGAGFSALGEILRRAAKTEGVVAGTAAFVEANVADPSADGPSAPQEPEPTEAERAEWAAEDAAHNGDFQTTAAIEAEEEQVEEPDLSAW